MIRGGRPSCCRRVVASPMPPPIGPRFPCGCFCTAAHHVCLFDFFRVEAERDELQHQLDAGGRTPTEPLPTGEPAGLLPVLGVSWDELPVAPNAEKRAYRTKHPYECGRVTGDHEWLRVSHYDAPGRRALWMRVTRDCLELRAGREADDSYASVAVGEVVTRAVWLQLCDLLLTARFGIESDLAGDYPHGECLHCGRDYETRKEGEE